MSQNLGLDVFFRQSEAGPVESERKSTPSTAAPTGKPPASVEEFVAQVTPAAERVAQRLGVPVSAVIGQWGVETGWGKSVIPGTNNLGNIKSTDGTGVFATDNYNGSRDRYRAYQSVDQFADDFARLLENRRYSGARGAQDAQTYFSGLQRGGYAEHPDYVSISVNAANMVDRVLGKQPRQGGSRSEAAQQPARELPDLTKAPAWADIAKNPEYQKLSKEERAAAKSAYFDYWIAPHGGDAQLRNQFLANSDAQGFDAGMAKEQFKSGVAGLQSGYYANAARNNAALINAMDKIDRGERVPIDQDPIGYADMNPDQRRQARNQVQGSFAGSAARAVKYMGEQQQYRSNPAAKATIELANKGDWKGAWNAFSSDPTGALQQLSVESAPNSIPAAVAAGTGVLLGGGVPAFIAGLAGGSFPVEFTASIAESLRESGVNLQDYAAVEAKLRDPAFIESAGKRAVTRGSVIATTDALSGGLALPLKAGAKQIAKNVGRGVANVGIEVGTEMAGEAGAQIASGEKVKLGDVLAEGLGAGPQAVGTTIAKTAAESFKRPDTPAAPAQVPTVQTPDGRLEPQTPPTAQPPAGAADPNAGAPPINPPTQPTQPQPSQDADAIVRELAQQAGVPLETVLPGSPAAGGQQFGDEDVLNFAASRLEQLTQKLGGRTRSVIGEQGEVVDQEVPGTPLSPAEADELALLEMAGNDAQALREFYGFNNQGVQNEALRQDQANGPASGADALGAAGLAGGPAAVTQPAADAAAGQGNAQGGEQQQGLSQQAVETDAEREARLEREAIQGEMPIATREPPDDLIERAKAANSLEELSAITQEALNRYPDSDPLGDGPSNDDGRNVAAVVQAARARVNELESKPKTEREARERREQEANAAQSQQVAGETPSAQGSQAGSAGSDQRRTTPGTRVSFGNVNEWVSGYREIDRRAPSSNRYRQLDAHVNELTDDFIAAETDADALTQLRSLFETANGLKPPRGQRAGSPYERVINAIDRRLTALSKPKTEREAREQRAAGQQSNVVSKIAAPDGMEVQVFKTSDGHGYGLYDKDAGQYVNGSVTRFSKGDTLAQATQGANELAKKATPVANKETETSEPAPAVKTDVFYDRQTRSWIVSRKDAQGNQVGDAEFFGSKGEAERAAGISPKTEKEARELRARQEESNAGTPGEVAPSDVRVASDQPAGDARDQQGAGEGAGGDVGSAAGAPTQSGGSDRTVQDAESERPDALDRPKTEREAREQRRPAVSENKVFTEDAAAKARELLKKKLSGSQLNAGIDPEVMQAGITLAGYHIEKGARTFAAFARAMLGDLGDAVRPYLKSWYMGVKYDPRAAEFSQGMDDAASVEAADVNGDFAEQAAEEPAPQAEPTGPDLSGVKVTFEVLVEDTGETAKMTVNAAEQVKELDERESLMRELIACLRK